MPPPTAAAVSQLRHLIYYNLDNDLLQNALFLAGRLHGLDPRSLETTYLVAQCHLKLGHFRAAYDYAKDMRLRSSASANSASASALLGCAYVFAQACLALRRHSEGINSLERCRNLWQGKNYWSRHSETERRPGPDAPAVCNLLGKLYKASGDEKKAAEHFAESLKGNPFMWDAFTDLSDAGVPIRTANIFKLTDDLRRYLFTVPVAVPVDPPQQNVPPQALASKPTNDPNTPAGYDPFNPTRSAVDPGLNYGGPNFMSRLNGGGNNPGISLSQAQSEWDTPITMNSNGTHYDEDITMDDSHTLPNESEAPHAPLRKKNGLQTLMGDMIDAPKIRSMTTRGRIKHDPPSELDGRPTTSGIPVSHKRTVSGLPPPSSAASSDAGVRRSTRIQNHVTAGTAPTAKSNASSRLAGVFKSDPKDKKELPKAKATGTRGRAGISTVGRVVSGNRKAPGPGERDIDSKELSRPASVASTIRSEATIRETTSKRGGASIHPNIIIEQQQSSHEEEGEALRWLLDLFAKLAEGYYNLTRYNAPKALEIFRALPPSQRETPWVLTKIGRALYERSQYKEAADVFAKVRKLHPSGNGRDSSAGESAYMEDMHIYSTTLWHLKRDIDLAYLSHSLISDDRLRPEPWVALGNCYSLQHEPDKAIRCFRRATQLCGERGVGAYAWTLMGHEHVAQEEFDRAQLCYREAISSNPRHYAGWYGLGSVYEKLGKYDIAERHYRIAWGVNPRNGVLAVCLGLVCEKLRKEGNTGSGAAWVLDPRGEGRVKEALAWYERAVRMDPKSAKARFMKARTLMRLAQMPASAASHGGRGGAGDNRHARLLQAKEELETLREMAPDESMVHFLLGRCFKLLGDRAGAIREMTIALELDPKASPTIKAALESLEGDDDEGSFDEDEND